LEKSTKNPQVELDTPSSVKPIRNMLPTPLQGILDLEL